MTSISSATSLEEVAKKRERWKLSDNLGLILANFQNSPAFCMQKAVSNIENFLRRNSKTHL